jgi:hypothetical protein
VNSEPHADCPAPLLRLVLVGLAFNLARWGALVLCIRGSVGHGLRRRAQGGVQGVRQGRQWLHLGR